MDAHHDTLEVAVFIGDGCIRRHHLHRRATLRVAGAVLHPGLHAVGVHHRRPDVVDAACGAHRCWRTAGKRTVGDRSRHRARAGVGVRVGVLVSDRLDDVLVFGRCARATDRDAGRAAAADDDVVAQRTRHAGTTARGQRFIRRAKVVVHCTGRDLHHRAGNRLGHIGSGHIDIADAEPARVGNGHTNAAAHQEVGDVARAVGAAVQIEQRRVVQVCHRDRDRIARYRKRRRAAVGGNIHFGSGCAAELIPGVVVKAGALAVLGIGHKAQQIAALEQERAASGYRANVGPGTAVNLELPLATSRWPGHRGTVNRNTLRRAVNVGHRRQQH